MDPHPRPHRPDCGGDPLTAQSPAKNRKERCAGFRRQGAGAPRFLCGQGGQGTGPKRFSGPPGQRDSARRGSRTLPAGAAGLCPPGQPDFARRGSVPEAGFPGLWVRPSASQRADAAPPPGILHAFPLRDRPRTGKAGDNAGISPRRPSRCGVLPFWVAAGAPTGYNRNETKKCLPAHFGGARGEAI